MPLSLVPYLRVCYKNSIAWKILAFFRFEDVLMKNKKLFILPAECACHHPATQITNNKSLPLSLDILIRANQKRSLLFIDLVAPQQSI